MTKKMISWLAGMAVFLILSSCRNDVFPEKEAFQNTGSFQLTSRRISLAESKHKLKLTPELSKAETFLKSLKTNVSGKTFNCGNGVSIDTDDVIYIENGPNYHTYTFHIKRENALPDDPVDNLVLVPLTDGTYRELMISYTLTEMEKQQILNGDNVDTKGKSSVVDLGISSLHPSASKSQDCQWVEADSYTWCSESMHNSGEGPDICHAQTRSKLVKVVLLKCTSVDDGTGNTGWSSGNGGSSGNNGGGSDSSQGGTEATQPCNGNGIATSPLDPSTDLGGNNCSGIPTIPNLPHPRNNPCTKIKAKFEDPKFKEKVAAIDKSEVFDYDHEMGYAAGYPPANTGVTGTQYPPMENVLGSHSVKLPDGNQYFGYIHSHNNESNGGQPIKIFSPYDVITFLTNCVRNADDHGSIGDAYCMVITSEGNYMLQYSGIGDYNIGPNQIQNWKNWYKDNFEELARADELTQPNVEKTFAQFLTESVNINGLEVYHVEKNTGKASKLNTNGTKTPCP